MFSRIIEGGSWLLYTPLVDKVGRKRKIDQMKTIVEETDASNHSDTTIAKREALQYMVDSLQFERDPSIDTATEFESENVGTISWTQKDKTTIFCNISPMMLMLRGDALRDYADVSREYTISEHGGIYSFPLRLRQLSEILRSAAIFAEQAGFLDFPNDADYKQRDHWVPPPFWGEDISDKMCSLSDILDIGRIVNEITHTEETVGNLAWFQDGKTFYCPITGVLDLIKCGKLEDTESEEYLEFLEDFGSLCSFPVRLRQLSQHLENAAIDSIDLNFLTIPDTQEDASSGGSDENTSEGEEDEDNDDDEGGE